MTDILIRGMDIPKNCSSCKIICWNYLEYGINGILRKLSTSESRDPNCPLVPLPEGHGDLIDRDAFRADNGLNAKCEHCPTNTYECQHDMIHTKMEFCGMLDDAPVIVPAEGDQA